MKQPMKEGALYATNRHIPNSLLSGLDRGGIWSFLWGMRIGGAGDSAIRETVSRWEKLTGRKY